MLPNSQKQVNIIGFKALLVINVELEFLLIVIDKWYNCKKRMSR